MLDKLREFVPQVPVLADLLERELLNDPGNISNTEEIRFHLEKVHKKVMDTLRAERKLYAVMHFPEAELHCPICQTVYHGYYWEVNNPVTGKGYIASQRLIHGLVAHEQLFLEEPMETVTGTRVGDTRLILDVATMSSVFKNADVPADVLEDLATAEAIQKKLLAEAPAVVASGGH